jgi:hypothetical protein
MYCIDLWKIEQNNFFIVVLYMTLKRRLSKRNKVKRKSKRTSKRISKRTSKRKKVKRNKTLSKTKRAGSPPITVDCCVCGKNEEVGKTLIPRKCLAKHGVSAHRICQDCWWDNKTGFALEGTKHMCPGCEKGLPLNKDRNKGEIIDLTDDD